MVEIKSKVELKEKGATANLPTIRQLLVSLSWKSSVDLDLMAFWKAKNGNVGGVYTENLGGSHGDLNNFPFMSLSGDEGVGGQGGDNEETMKIMKLDDIEKLYLVALNYTDAKNKNADASFSHYDGKVTVMDDTGNAFEVSLASTEKGTAALIATIDNSNPIGATLKAENSVMSLSQFIETVPGADALTK